MASVTSLNTLTGAINLVSAGNTVAISVNALLKQINLDVNLDSIDQTQVTEFHFDFAADSSYGATSPYFYGLENASGTATIVNNYNRSDWLGVFRLNAGSTAGKGAMWYAPGNANVFIKVGSGEIQWKSRGYLSALSQALSRFYRRSGLGQRVYNGDTPGIYFRYTDNVNSGKYVCVCRGSITETTINTSITPSINIAAPDILSFTVNAAGTSVEFFINGTSVGSITTDIPTQELQIWEQHSLTSGTIKGGDADIDYINLKFIMNRG